MNIKKILMIITIVCIAVLSGFSESKATEPPVLPPTTEYIIGDIGPAGGIIFYDKGFVSDGWRYLEVAPVGSEFNGSWGAFDHAVVGTELGIGTGKRNTELIVAELAELSETGRAAQICADMDVNGFRDWFLPSIHELNLMFLNKLIIGGLQDRNYWSSSQSALCPYSAAWSQSSDRGLQDNYFKTSELSVRAIRSF